MWTRTCLQSVRCSTAPTRAARSAQFGPAEDFRFIPTCRTIKRTPCSSTCCSGPFLSRTNHCSIRQRELTLVRYFSFKFKSGCSILKIKIDISLDGHNFMVVADGGWTVVDGTSGSAPVLGGNQQHTHSALIHININIVLCRHDCNDE